MTLQQLKYLVTVAECRNITEAAEKLFISQPSLSAAIHNLESEMGVTAFVRSNKGVSITREGEELLSFARNLLEQAEIMKDHFCADEKPTLNFAFRANIILLRSTHLSMLSANMMRTNTILFCAKLKRAK